jgi:hypothetical protein
MKWIVALISVAVLVGCGGGGGRPSTDEIAKALEDENNSHSDVFKDAGTPDKIVACIARVLHDSNLSDHALRTIVDDEDYDALSTMVDDDPRVSNHDKDAVEDALDDLGRCFRS